MGPEADIIEDLKDYVRDLEGMIEQKDKELANKNDIMTVM